MAAAPSTDDVPAHCSPSAPPANLPVGTPRPAGAAEPCLASTGFAEPPRSPASKKVSK